HPRLAFFISQDVIGVRHFMGSTEAHPFIHHSLRDSVANAERTQKSPQAVNRQSVLFPPSRIAELATEFLEVDVDRPDIQPVAAVRKLLASGGSEEPPLTALRLRFQQGTKSLMDRNFPFLAGLCFCTVARQNVNPVPTEIG